MQGNEEELRQAGLEDTATSEAPDSLLVGVLSRLEQRRSLIAATPLPDLLAALTHPQWEMRAAAVRSLGERGTQAPLAPLQAALHDEHRLVRAAAVRALGRQGTRVPLEVILLAMKDPAWEVREMVVLVLVELGHEAADPLKALLQAARQDTHNNVRDAATYALNKYALLPVVEQQREVLETTPALWLSTALRALERWGVLLKQQIRLIHKSVWLSAPLLFLFWGLQCFFAAAGPFKVNIHEAGLFMALYTTIASAAGVAFIFGRGGEQDDGFELTLATPTSIRAVMLCRFLVVVSYNVLLSGSISLLIAILQGGGLWSFVQLWLGPLILVSSFTLMLSLMIGSWFATLAAFLIELSQAVVLNVHGNWPVLNIAFSGNWQTNPLFFCMALLLLVIAVLYMMRQPYLPTS